MIENRKHYKTMDRKIYTLCFRNGIQKDRSVNLHYVLVQERKDRCRKFYKNVKSWSNNPEILHIFHEIINTSYKDLNALDAYGEKAND